MDGTRYRCLEWTNHRDGAGSHPEVTWQPVIYFLFTMLGDAQRRGRFGGAVANHRPNLNSSLGAGMRNCAHPEFGLDSLQKISNYRRQAEECRLLARKAQNEEHRSQLLIMAETWETLAVERESLLRKPPSSNSPGAHQAPPGAKLCNT